MIAIRLHRMEIIRFLVDQGVDLERENQYCMTAMNEACTHLNVEAVEYLLAQGADFNHRKGHLNDNAVDFAASIGT